MKPSFYLILSWLITILTPFILIGLGVRLLLTPLFPNIEYRTPWFPKDEYGFTAADRLHWGPMGIEYLLNNADISFLGDLKFPDGSPLFNERELSHMHDVKGVTQEFLRLWDFALFIAALLAVWAYRQDWLPVFRQGWRRGGWLTLVLAFTIGIIATVGASGNGDMFWAFFEDFHGLFFKGDTWLFPYSDTLIRLYPLQFWQDAILYIGIIAALGALALAFGLKPQYPLHEGPNR
jgi:integral membrane protein (TIGR01906 family)